MQGTLLVTVAVLVGCGGPHSPGQPGGDAPPAAGPTDAPPAVEPTDGARSGSRLEINYWQASGGFRAWTGTFHDSQLGVDCTVQPWSDGNTYCTPTPYGWSFATQRGLWDYSDNVALAPPWDGIGGQIEYRDAACTQPIAAVQQYISSDSFFTDSTSNVCSSLYERTVNHLYHLQGMVSVTQQPYVMTPYGCMPPGTSTNDRYYAFDEVAPTSLVRVTRQIESSADRVTTVSLVSDDGMVLPMGPYDRDLASPCYMHQQAGVEYCVPVDPAYDAPNRERADPTCATVLAASPASCPAPLTSTTAAAPFFEFNPDAFTSIAAPATQIYALMGGGSCAPATPQSYYAYYARGPVVTLATGTRVHDNLPGQRLDYVRVDAGTYAGRETALYDQALASECKLTVSAGRIVCAPINSCGAIEQVEVDSCGSPTSFFDATGCSTTPRFVFDARNTLKVVGPEVTVTSCHSENITLPPPCDCSGHVTAHALEEPTDADLAQLVSFVLTPGP